MAVKVLDARLAADSGLRERFLAESRLASRLTHPHIVPVYAHGRDEGCDYMAMPLVETELGAMIGRYGALVITRALNIAEQVAWALDVPTSRGSCIATSSRRTSSSARAASGTSPTTPSSPTSASPSSRTRRVCGRARSWGPRATPRPSRPWARRSTGAATSTRWPACSSSA